MGRIVVQVYGFVDVATALAAARLGVDHIGFIAGVYGLVANEVDFESARAIAETLPPSAKSVALTMATNVEEILRMVRVVRPDILHISTDPFDVGPGAMAQLKRRLGARPLLMKAIPVTTLDETLDLVRTFEPWTDMILLDTKVEGLPGVGATGRTHDWEVSRRVVEMASRPVILAGGLAPENVAQAVRLVRPWGVDSFSGTNVPGTTVKDLARIKAFVAAVRAVEVELD